MWKPPTFDERGMTPWQWMVQNREGLELGERTDIGAFTYINALHGVAIGDEVEVGSHCSIYSVSTIDGKHGRVVIGRGARLGSHSTVMPGVKIGAFALVGAHSFVNRDVPDGMIAYGIPARLHDGRWCPVCRSTRLSTPHERASGSCVVCFLGVDA